MKNWNDVLLANYYVLYVHVHFKIKKSKVIPKKLRTDFLALHHHLNFRFMILSFYFSFLRWHMNLCFAVWFNEFYLLLIIYHLVLNYVLFAWNKYVRCQKIQFISFVIIGLCHFYHFTFGLLYFTKNHYK